MVLQPHLFVPYKYLSFKSKICLVFRAENVTQYRIKPISYHFPQIPDHQNLILFPRQLFRRVCGGGPSVF